MRYHKHYFKTLTRVQRSNIDFDYLFDEISHDWQYKARRLQARRWRKLNSVTDSES
jgi:hypothetical protein